LDKELELENKFIQLWNEGKSYDEISEMIGVDIEKIRRWGTDLIIANNELFDEKKYVLGKLEDGKYVSSDGKEFPERLLFKLEESKNYTGGTDLFFSQPPDTVVACYPKWGKKIGVVCIAPDDYKTQWFEHIENFNLSFENLIRNYEIHIIKLLPLFSGHISDIEKSLSSSKKVKVKSLPIAILRFSFQNYEAIKKAIVTNLPINSQWIFLTGVNGYGKSSVLKGIALSLTKASEEYQNGNFKTRLGIEYFKNDVVGRKSIKNVPYNTILDTNSLKNFAAYGPSRLTLQEREARNEESRRSEPLYSLFNTDGLLLNIEYRLFISSLKDIAKFEKIKNLLMCVVPDLKDVFIKDEEIFYVEKSPEDESYKPVKFNELAAGYKSVIAMVGDIYLRLSKHQPEKEIKELGGIVLIDELDVHLHPKWQRKLPKLLSDAFPKVQFIASTHSPIPFLGAPKNAVFLKVDRTPEEGITCERIDIDVTNLTPNLILTSPIFGFDEIISDDAKNNIGEVHTEGSYKELKENEALRKRLLEFEHSDRDFPDDLFEKNPKPSNPTETQ